MNLRTRVASRAANFRRFLPRGRAHRRRLADLDVRVAVTGTRGKSTAVAWLYEALAARGYDVYAKVTGEEPQSMYAGVSHPIERDGPVRLYETEREIRRFDPADAIVVENQGIREYTTRLVSADYVDPTIVVLTNVRRDHLHTLGRDLGDLAEQRGLGVGYLVDRLDPACGLSASGLFRHQGRREPVSARPRGRAGARRYPGKCDHRGADRHAADRHHTRTELWRQDRSADA